MNIKNIMKKGKWTGKEVGKVAIALLVSSFKGDGTPIIPPEDFRRMDESITSDRQRAIMGTYRAIYNAMITEYNYAGRMQALFKCGYYPIHNYLQKYITKEQIDSERRCLPLIVTQKQYDDLYKKCMEDRANEKICGGKLFFEIFEVFKYNEDECPDELKKELLKIENSGLETDKDLIKLYNEEWVNYKYRLPDGRLVGRNDISQEEWIEAKVKKDGKPFAEFVNKYGYRRAYDEMIELNREDVCSLVFEGEKKVLEAYKKKFGKEFDEDEVHMTIDEFCERLLDFDTGDETINKFYYGDDPFEKVYETLTPSRKDSMETLLPWCKYYSEYEPVKYVKIFKKHFPDVYKIIDKYMKTSLKKDKLTYKETFTMKELKELGIPLYYDYESDANIDYSIIDKFCKENCDTPSNYTGIAIYKGADLEQKNDCYKAHYGFAHYEDNIYKLEEEEDIQSYYYLVTESMRILFSYNAAVDLLSDYYDIECMKELKIDEDEIIRLCDNFNYLLTGAFQITGGTDEEKRSKRRSLQDTFSLIRFYDYKPTTEAIEKTADEIERLAFTDESRDKLNDITFLMDMLERECDDEE